MKKYFNIFVILLAAVVFTACDDYLDVKPSKSTSLTVETGEQLNAMLNAYSVYYLEQSPWLINASDDQRCDTEWFEIKFPHNPFTTGQMLLCLGILYSAAVVFAVGSYVCVRKRKV